MSILLDIIVLLIVVITVIINLKRGFIKSIMGLISLILTFFIISAVSEPASEFIYDNFVHQAVCEAVEEKQEEIAKTGAELAWDSLPEFVRDSAEIADITEQELLSVFESSDSQKEKSEEISRNIIRPAAISVTSIILDIILFAVLMIIFGFVSKFICSFFKIPLLKEANKFLGAILGLIKGIIIAAFVCSIIGYIVESGMGEFYIFTESAISESVLFKYFSEVL